MAIETHALKGRATHHTYKRLRVSVVSGTDQGREQASDGDELTVGTEQGNQLVLTDPSVSRHHLSIRATPLGLQVRDLGSTNGTLLQGTRLEVAYVRPGTVLAIGSSNVRIDTLDEEVRQELSAEDAFGLVLGCSAAMRHLFAIMPRIAAADATVLLEGETGTGKGLVAETIHRESPRANQPFQVIDCGAIPPNLIESELFGHEKGAFTGAHAARAGAFEAAQGGTVFLDEIGELPFDMQPRLLRVLEQRQVKRIGGTKTIKIDVRVIAATNRDLRKMINQGTFRSDLFFRISTLRLRIPPLRERRDDIGPLIKHFYDQFVTDKDPSPPKEIVDRMSKLDWPGNVRELRSAVERMVLLGHPEEDFADAAPKQTAAAAQDNNSMNRRASDRFDETTSFRSAKEVAVTRWERWFLSELVRRANGNLSQAARAAKMDRNYLRELLTHHGISAKSS